MRDYLFRIRIWMQWCKCGHPIDVHQHFRGNNDCGICGKARCNGFRMDWRDFPR